MPSVDKKAKLLIFGLGRLGSYLLDELSPTFEVLGTRTSEKKGSSVELYSLGNPMPAFDKTISFVIWCIPPRPLYKESLVLANKYFPSEIPFIFVSSTSVYQSDGLKTEESQRDGKQNIIELEETLKSFSRPTSIIRPSGLVDNKRHPKNFFKNNSSPEGGESPVNLVHTEDVARFIGFLIKEELCGEDFNLASDTHLSKKEFYNGVREIPLQFSSKGSLQKIISSEKAKSFGFDFKYKDLLKYFNGLND
ncbi:MAG: hypothetical protein ACO2ZP_01850 [Bacteriovoracaceae bacterium]